MNSEKSGKVLQDEKSECRSRKGVSVFVASRRTQPSRSVSATFKFKDYFLCGVARALLGFIRILPFSLVLRFGRALGEIVFWFDFRHRRVALENLNRCFGQQKSQKELRQIVRENFRRLGEAFGGAMK